MLKAEEIRRLASLSRLAVSEEELAGLGQDLEKILAYVARLNEIKLSDTKFDPTDPLTVNKMREDSEPHPSGGYSDILVEQFSSGRNGFLEVKPILTNDKK